MLPSCQWTEPRCLPSWCTFPMGSTFRTFLHRDWPAVKVSSHMPMSVMMIDSTWQHQQQTPPSNTCGGDRLRATVQWQCPVAMSSGIVQWHCRRHCPLSNASGCFYRDTCHQWTWFVDAFPTANWAVALQCIEGNIVNILNSCSALSLHPTTEHPCIAGFVGYMFYL